MQKARGIRDTPDLAFDDWIKWGGPSVDTVWARYYIDHTLHDLYHWTEALGVSWADLKPQEGNSVLRWTRSERNGLGLMTHLVESFCRKAARSLGRRRSPGCASGAATLRAWRAAMPGPESR